MEHSGAEGLSDGSSKDMPNITDTAWPTYGLVRFTDWEDTRDMIHSLKARLAAAEAENGRLKAALERIANDRRSSAWALVHMAQDALTNGWPAATAPGPAQEEGRDD